MLLVERIFRCGILDCNLVETSINIIIKFSVIDSELLDCVLLHDLNFYHLIASFSTCFSVLFIQLFFFLQLLLLFKSLARKNGFKFAWQLSLLDLDFLVFQLK